MPSVSVHRVHLRRWQPSEAAVMLWLILAAMLLGLVMELALGHPFALTAS
jgi:hypothetical protein